MNKEGEKEADPVELNLYYEVLCPDCKQFISDQVGKAVEQIGDIMNLTLVPYGNAQVSKYTKKISIGLVTIFLDSSEWMTIGFRLINSLY